MSESILLQVMPLKNLVPVPDVEGGWESVDDDPQFLLTPSAGGAGAPLWGGWYLFSAHLPSSDGQVVSPCLYPDYGSGVSHHNSEFLPDPDLSGWVRGVVRFKQDVQSLRFDPSVRKSAFAIQEVSVRRLGRIEALRMMLPRMRTPSGEPDWPAIRSTLWAFLKEALRGRVRAGGEIVYQSYVQSASSRGRDYATWVDWYDTFDGAKLADLRTQAGQLARKPLISVVIPVYQTPEKWLRRCLDSVVNQAYQNWELCIADDASPSPHVRRVLEEYAKRDPRIRVVYRSENGHISAATQSAIETARGEYVALLDHDDELSPNALLEVARAVNRHPEWKLIYSDEDKIDESGRRFDPYFKPDWNYDLLLAQNYICHLCVFDAQLLAQVGGPRVGFEGSQDHDLLLRCAEHLESSEIGHVHRVLYHWRAISGSTARGMSEKSYAQDAGRRAIAEHLGREQVSATVHCDPRGHYRVDYALPDPAPKVSLIIPTRNKVELLKVCVDSILEKTSYQDYEILIVDNQSSEEATLSYFRSLATEPRVRVLSYDAPFNYSAINNFAARQAAGTVIGLVNNDIEVIGPDWLDEMVSQAMRSKVGAVGAKLLYPDDTIQHAGVIVGIGGVAGHSFAGRDRADPGYFLRAQLVHGLSAVTAACLLVRKQVFDEVGGLDEQLSVAFNDVDFCLRVRAAGYQNLWTPYAELYHHESASRGYEDTPEKLERFRCEIEFMRKRWGGGLLEDPAYNLNLSLYTNQYDLAFPPRVSDELRFLARR